MPFPPKDQQNKEIKTQMQILTEICQNRTTGKDVFFRKSSIAQIKKCETNESYITTWGTFPKKFKAIQRSG